jgi:uncharacterized protein YcsI (UPF0317 family)
LSTTLHFESAVDLRRACRDGSFKRDTAGQAPGRIQANLMILPKAHAFDFLLFCQRNPKPCPLVEVLSAGSVEPACAVGANIASDVPGYRVYRDGQLAEERDDVRDLWNEEMVSFLIGCSFSFESAVQAAGVRMRHIDQGRNVAMYRTNVPCVPAGIFEGEMVVSMRPIKSRDVARVVEIAARLPIAHGAPVHIGNPEALEYGDAVDIMGDEVPVFWACGVTPQWVAQRSRLPLCITHAPGKMFVTDLVG